MRGGSGGERRDVPRLVASSMQMRLYVTCNFFISSYDCWSISAVLCCCEFCTVGACFLFTYVVLRVLGSIRNCLSLTCF